MGAYLANILIICTASLMEKLKALKRFIINVKRLNNFFISLMNLCH